MPCGTCCLKNSLISIAQECAFVKHFQEKFQNYTPYLLVATRTPGPIVVAMVALLKY